MRLDRIQAQHFATAWFGSKLSDSEDVRERFRGFIDGASDAVEGGEWPLFEEGKHYGLSLEKRTAGA